VANGTPPLLRVSHLAACYGEVQALWDVNVEGHAGELVVMVGANGAGKTTTIRSICGMVRATGGTIEFKGESIKGATPSRIVDMGIGHVPEGRALFPHMTVRENLVLGAYLPGPRRRWRRSLDRVFALFPRLQQRERQLAGTLSGGEQQMCAIGRGLMSEPALLMLDEPSLGLAPILVDEMFRIIAEVQRSGMTVLLVEQHVAQALSLADRAFVVSDGRTVGSGTGAALLADPKVREAYLSV
jgi:branched-chain amino acid transport system ATP-binding protein